MLEFPLPFRSESPEFEYNRAVALNRTKSTLDNMKKKHPKVFQSSLEKFQKNIETDSPRFFRVPHESNRNPNGCAYWIPLFSVWQKQKARIVFDAAAKTGGRCLNDTLLQGPDRNNSLRAVIHRFRKHPYAATADIENMFHQVAIPEEQTTYMRFFWYCDNDPTKELVEYRSRVHLMGLKSSPALANLAVRYAARQNPPTSGDSWLKEDDLLDPQQQNREREPDETERILTKSFYVDDSLISASTPENTVHTLKEGIRRLGRYELKLTKIQTNCEAIRSHFKDAKPLPPVVDFAPEDNSTANPAMGHSLGLQWNTEADTFQIKMEFKDRKKTKRGFLGMIMSPFDPSGAGALAMLATKLLQREIFPAKTEDPMHLQEIGWDDPIPPQFHKQWDEMLQTVREMPKVSFPRSFYKAGNGTPKSQRLYAFADASDLAICYVIYLRTELDTGIIEVAFVAGNSMVIPRGAIVKGMLSIPRAELSAAEPWQRQQCRLKTT